MKKKLIVLSAISIDNLKTLKYHAFVVNFAVMLKKYLKKKNQIRC